MLDKNAIMDVLEQALADVQRNAQVVHPFSPDLKLIGREGVLDSLDSMLFLDAVDELLSAKAGKNIVIVNDEAFSRHESPFRTVQSLADYIEEAIRP